MSSSSFAESKEALLGGDARGGGRTGRGEVGAGGADIEAPETEALIDDIILPLQSASSDSIATARSHADGDNSSSVGDGDDTISRTSVNSPTPPSQYAVASPAAAAAPKAAAAPNAAASPGGSAGSSRSSSRTSSSDESSRRSAADWEEEELGGTVVGKAGRRRSSGARRRRSSGGSGRRRSSGLLDRWVVLAARVTEHSPRAGLVADWLPHFRLAYSNSYWYVEHTWYAARVPDGVAGLIFGGAFFIRT